MTTLPPELEALMPEPAFQTLSADYFTADQVRQAMLDATERAAKKAEPKGARPCDCTLCDCGNSGDARSVAYWDEANAIAAAIRGDGGQG